MLLARSPRVLSLDLVQFVFIPPGLISPSDRLQTVCGRCAPDTSKEGGETGRERSGQTDRFVKVTSGPMRCCHSLGISTSTLECVWEVCV